VSQPASHPPTLPFITTNNTSRSLQDFALVAVERVAFFLDRQQRLDDKAQHKHQHDKTTRSTEEQQVTHNLIGDFDLVAVERVAFFLDCQQRLDDDDPIRQRRVCWSVRVRKSVGQSTLKENRENDRKREKEGKREKERHTDTGRDTNEIEPR
jgi:hypothetical protein